ncbi:YegP family protein [Urbifossiella limnaea]|uniref:DUF1508 domain-containing protein n=1 Tax=Urbifossiella limnaea TaxID=2528023 RepID=A0A517Y0G0_9BACT|nr:DUF1508 domain-containing protein [Urbifossiella limnaea]QDU23241.1 hypothetical protein ETAA1_52330 [Urbifossiella limnaea]
MTKLLSGLCAAALVVGLAGTGGVTTAQDKKDTKKDTKTAPAKGGTIEINESKDGKFRFTVRDAEGKYLGGSATGYATKEDAAKAVDALKAALGSAKIEYGKSK